MLRRSLVVRAPGNGGPASSGRAPIGGRANPTIQSKRQARALASATAREATSRGGMNALPSSGAAWAFKMVRPYLPPQWQYGWRYNLLKAIWLVCAFSFVGLLAKTMFFQSEEEVLVKASRYTYVRDDEGNVVDISYKPLIDSALRARRRQERRIDEIRDQQQQQYEDDAVANKQ